MRKKHWQGYGVLDIKKIKDTKKDGIRNIEIRVRGNHEYGLELPYNDKYTLAQWLGSVGKFTYDEVISYTNGAEEYELIDGLSTGVCYYNIKAKVKENARS